jgi:hypothetical protein
MDEVSKERETAAEPGMGTTAVASAATGSAAAGSAGDARTAEEIRARVAGLNEALAAAARAGLRVELQQTSHQTSGGVPMTVLEATIYRRL